MADITPTALCGIVYQKAMELAARASFLAEKAEAGEDVEFLLHMLDESDRTVSFWVDELRKAARK